MGDKPSCGRRMPFWSFSQEVKAKNKERKQKEKQKILKSAKNVYQVEDAAVANHSERDDDEAMQSLHIRVCDVNCK